MTGHPASLRGTVDIAVLERANPRQVFLAQVDDAIREAQRNAVQKTPGHGPADQFRAVSILQTSEPLRAHRTAARQAERLAALQAEILTNLGTRLQRADGQRLASIRSRLDTETEQSYFAEVAAIDDRAETGESAAASKERDAAVSLLTKIRALTVDVQPPPTAPEGYWSKRLAERQAEFEALESRRHALIAQIRSGRDAQRQDLRTQLQAVADASYAAAASSAEARRESLLAVTEKRLKSQTADLLASSKVLDAEADAVAMQTARTPGNKLLRGEDASAGPAPPAPAERDDLSALIEERTRLRNQIRQQTLQTVNEVARSRNATIVGFEQKGGVPDLTDDVLKWVRLDRWG